MHFCSNSIANHLITYNVADRVTVARIYGRAIRIANGISNSTSNSITDHFAQRITDSVSHDVTDSISNHVTHHRTNNIPQREPNIVTYHRSDCVTDGNPDEIAHCNPHILVPHSVADRDAYVKSYCIAHIVSLKLTDYGDMLCGDLHWHQWGM